MLNCNYKYYYHYFYDHYHHYYLIPSRSIRLCLHSQVAGARRSGHSAYVGAGPGVGATPPAPSRGDDGQGGRAEHGVLLYYIAPNVYIVCIIILFILHGILYIYL